MKAQGLTTEPPRNSHEVAIFLTQWTMTEAGLAGPITGSVLPFTSILEMITIHPSGNAKCPLAV